MSKSEIINALHPIVELLEELKIPYYIGGSVASSALGISRSTMDVDVITDFNPAVIKNLVQRLSKEYYIDGEMIRDAFEHKSSFNIIHNSTSYKIDFFISKTSDYQQTIFDRIIRKKFVDQNETIEIFICSPEDVILTKLIWYKERGGVSEKQWSDILGVLKVQKNQLDMNYLDYWSEKLFVNVEFLKAKSEAGII